MNGATMILAQGEFSADWRDYVPLIIFLLAVPAIWWCARTIWRALPQGEAVRNCLLAMCKPVWDHLLRTRTTIFICKVIALVRRPETKRRIEITVLIIIMVATVVITAFLVPPLRSPTRFGSYGLLAGARAYWSPSVRAKECQWSLMLIAYQKADLVKNRGFTNNQPVADAQLGGIMHGVRQPGKTAWCPDRGKYTANAIGQKPSCSIHGELLREANWR